MPRPWRETDPGGRAGWTLSESLVTGACLVTLLIGILGALELVSAIRQRAPLELQYADLVSGNPEGKWVRVVDGQLDFDLYLAVDDGSGTVERIFAPLRAPTWRRGVRADDRTPVDVMVSIEGSEAHRRARTDDLVRGLGGVWTGGVERRTVEGVAHVVTRFSGDDREALRPLESALADRIVVIDEGERPDAFLGIALLFGAVVVGILLFCVARMTSPQRHYRTFPLLTPGTRAVGRGARSRHRR